MSINKIMEHINNDFFLSNDETSIEMLIKAKSIDKKSVKNRWLGYRPATQIAIAKRERELGSTLPPSYKEFLSVSNGFRNVSFFLDNLFPIEKVDWAKNTEEKWWLDMNKENINEVSDEQYFYYEEDQDPVLSREEYLVKSLKLSEWYDGMCIFLNPIIKFGEEWEVLEYANWLPGIQRYKSFADYLCKVHSTNQFLLKRAQEKNNIS